MKKLGLIGSYLLLLFLGVFLGREFFPKVVVAPELESSPQTQTIKEGTSNEHESDSPVSSSQTTLNIDELLDLVVTEDPFKTSTQLRKVLADSSGQALENYLNELVTNPVKEHKRDVVRTSLLNHLIAKNPQRAFDFVVHHEDEEFRRLNAPIVVRGLARHDPQLARNSLDLIKDLKLQQAAHLTLQQMGIGASPKSLISILRSAKNAGFSGPMFPDFSSPMGTTALIDAGDFDNSTIRYEGYRPWFGQPSDTYFGILSRLTKDDFAAAEDFALGIEDKHQRGSALSTIASALAAKNPKEALAWINSLDLGDDKEQPLYSVLMEISRHDPQFATTEMTSIKNPSLQKQLVANITSTWVTKDFVAAMSWVDSLPESSSKIQAYSTAIDYLVRTGSGEVGTYLDKLPTSLSTDQVPKMLSNWVRKDFNSAKEWIIKQTDPRLLGASLTSLIPVWTKNNPREVAAYLDNSSLVPSENTTKLYREFAGEWASSDREAALSWALKIESSGLKHSATNTIYYRWASADPEGAAQLLSSTTSPDQRKLLLESVVYNLGRKDPTSGQEWFFNLSHEDRYQAARRFISAIESNHPAQAASVYDQLAAGTSDEDQMKWIHYGTSSIARNWSAKDLDGAAAWASQISDTGAREQAIPSVANTWIEKDAEAAARWIHQLPNDKGKDRATSSLAKHVEKIDPESAFEWALSIKDSNMRSETLGSSLRAWSRFDLEAAKEAVQTANLTEKERARFLKIYK